MMGGGSGSVCIAVDSDTWGPPFESSHQKTFAHCQMHWKDQNKEKRPERDNFIQKNFDIEKKKVKKKGPGMAHFKMLNYICPPIDNGDDLI